MKWFFSLNEAFPTLLDYTALVKVVVHSALIPTSLIPHCLYDGEENSLTDWLRERKVRIIDCRTLSTIGSVRFQRNRTIRRFSQSAPGLFCGGSYQEPSSNGDIRSYTVGNDRAVAFVNDLTEDRTVETFRAQRRWISASPNTFEGNI